MLSIVLFFGGHPTLVSVAVIRLSKEKKSNVGRKGLFHPRTPRSNPSLRELGGIHVINLEKRHGRCCLLPYSLVCLATFLTQFRLGLPTVS